MFAGSCIGVILLVCALEFLRRLGREYDRYIIAKANKNTFMPTSRASRVLNVATEYSPDRKATYADVAERAPDGTRRRNDDNGDDFPLSGVRESTIIRPTLAQQVIRAALHMLQFGVAYFIMLLAMYYNGYIIICILLGALIGAFIFSWDLGVTDGSRCCG